MSTHIHSWTSQDSNGRRKNHLDAIPMPFCICRGSFPLTVHESLLAETACSHVSELGLRKIRVSCQGGHWWGLLTVKLLFQGWRFQPHPSRAGASAGPSSLPSCVYSALGCPWSPLAKGWLPDVRSEEDLKGIAPVRIGPKLHCSPLSW